MPYLGAYLLRHPWRVLRLPGALLELLRYLMGRGDRGALKGALIHALLGGASRAEIARWNATFLPRVLRRGLFAEALALIQWHREQHHLLVLLSASPDLYVPELARQLGFERASCTTLRWREDQRLDGRLAGPNCRGDEKRARLAALRAELAPDFVYAYGNSTADLAHLALADQGWFVNGSSKVTLPGPQIKFCRWQRRGGVTAT